MASRVDLNLLLNGTFARGSSAYLGSPAGLTAFGNDVRRTKRIVEVSRSAGEILTGECGADGDARAWCENSRYLFAVANGATNKVYRSADGVTWSLCYTGALNITHMFRAAGERIVSFFATTVSGYTYWVPYYSDDDGVTWTKSANSAGGDPLLAYHPFYTGLKANSRGTIVAATYNSYGSGDNVGVDFTAATWTEATKTITKTGQFTNYPWAAGRKVWVKSGTGISTPVLVEIVSKTNNTLVLAQSCGVTDGAANLAGSAGLNQIWRSSDNGATWTMVLETCGHVRHCHAVCYHEATGQWIVDTGDTDGAAPPTRQYHFVSTDDGLTWTNWNGSAIAVNGMPSPNGQITSMIDFGHATRVLVGADNQAGLYWMDVTDWTLSSPLDWFNAAPTGSDHFCYELFQYAGVLYACFQSTLASGSRKAYILASPDGGETWGLYHRFSQNTAGGVFKLAGIKGGKIHCLMNDAGVLRHFAMLPARCSVRNGVVLTPQITNLHTATDSKCETGGGGVQVRPTGWSDSSGGVVCEPHTGPHKLFNQSVQYVRTGLVDQTFYVVPPNVTTVVGQVYVAHGWIKTNARIITVAINGQGSLPYRGRVHAGWCEFWSKPFTATATTHRIQIIAYCPPPTGALELYIGAIGLYEVPCGLWSLGGGAQAADQLSFSHALGTDWTLIGSAQLIPSGGELGTALQYLATVKVGASYVSVAYDPATLKWVLGSSASGNTSLSTAQYLLRGGLVRYALRHAAGATRLSVCTGEVEHLAALADAPALAGSGSILIGNSSGGGVYPQVLARLSVHDYCMSNSDVESLFAELAVSGVVGEFGIHGRN